MWNSEPEGADIPLTRPYVYSSSLVLLAVTGCFILDHDVVLRFEASDRVVTAMFLSSKAHNSSHD